jgi:hypothetical protein
VYNVKNQTSESFQRKNQLKKVVILQSEQDAEKIAAHLYNVERANNHLIFSPFDPSAFKCAAALEGLNEKSYEYFVGTILLEVELIKKLYSLKLAVKRIVSGTVHSSGYADFTLFLTPEVLSLAETVQNIPQYCRWRMNPLHEKILDIDYVALVKNWDENSCTYSLFVSGKTQSGLFSLSGIQQFIFEDV